LWVSLKSKAYLKKIDAKSNDSNEIKRSKITEIEKSCSGLQENKA